MVIDFAKVREFVPVLTEAEFDAVWAHLGQAVRIAAKAKQRHAIASLAVRNMSGRGIAIAGHEGPHSLVKERP